MSVVVPEICSINGDFGFRDHVLNQFRTKVKVRGDRKEQNVEDWELSYAPPLLEQFFGGCLTHNQQWRITIKLSLAVKGHQAAQEGSPDAVQPRHGKITCGLLQERT
jgi:hypothetical protein